MKSTTRELNSCDCISAAKAIDSPWNYEQMKGANSSIHIVETARMSLIQIPGPRRSLTEGTVSI